MNFWMLDRVGSTAITVRIRKAAVRSGLLAAVPFGSLGFAGQKLHPLDDHVELGPLLTIFLPGILLELALDEDRGTLGKILADELGGSAEEGQVDEGGFIDPFAGGVFSPVVDSDRILAHSQLGVGRVPDLDISDEVSDEDHSVEAGHNRLHEKNCKRSNSSILPQSEIYGRIWLKISYRVPRVPDERLTLRRPRLRLLPLLQHRRQQPHRGVRFGRLAPRLFLERVRRVHRRVEHRVG